MRTRRLTHPLLAASMTLALAACASGGGGEATAEGAEPSADEISVQVTNDMTPPSDVTVYMAPTSGARRRLGTVGPNDQGSFTFQPRVRTMEHRLVAEGTGRNASTDPFVLTGVTGVRWTVSNRVAQIIR